VIAKVPRDVRGDAVTFFRRVDEPFAVEGVTRWQVEYYGDGGTMMTGQTSPSNLHTPADVPREHTRVFTK
jgi:hypothetical protein